MDRYKRGDALNGDSWHFKCDQVMFRCTESVLDDSDKKANYTNIGFGHHWPS